jgi:hypothetical protein
VPHCETFWVVNDGANALSVFCFAGDTMGGVLNGSLPNRADGFGLFLKVDQTLGQHVHVTTVWRALRCSAWLA